MDDTDDAYGPLTSDAYARTVPCGTCNTINTRRPSRLCDGCVRPYHITCVGMTKRLSRELRRWVCPTCRNDANNNDRGVGADDAQAIDEDEIAAQLPQLIGK